MAMEATVAKKLAFVPEYVVGKVGNVTTKLAVIADGTTKNCTRFTISKNDASANGSVYVSKAK